MQHEREARERQRKLEATKSMFFRAASHELRTPIMVCRGHLDVLDPGAGREEVAQTLSIVADELDRMGRLVQDITTLTRLEDPDALRAEAIDVGQLLREVSAKAEPLLDGRLRVEDSTAGRVQADRQRLNQALLGMLDNAATHAGPEARVFIRRCRSRAAGGSRSPTTAWGSRGPSAGLFSRSSTVRTRRGPVSASRSTEHRPATAASGRPVAFRGNGPRRRDLWIRIPMKVLSSRTRPNRLVIVKGLSAAGYEAQHAAPDRGDRGGVRRGRRGVRPGPADPDGVRCSRGLQPAAWRPS